MGEIGYPNNAAVLPESPRSRGGPARSGERKICGGNRVCRTALPLRGKPSVVRRTRPFRRAHDLWGNSVCRAALPRCRKPSVERTRPIQESARLQLSWKIGCVRTALPRCRKALGARRTMPFRSTHDSIHAVGEIGCRKHRYRSASVARRTMLSIVTGASLRSRRYACSGGSTRRRKS